MERHIKRAPRMGIEKKIEKLVNKFPQIYHDKIVQNL